MLPLHIRFNGKCKTSALGIYPATSLKEAREKRDTAKKQIDGGIDPNENKKAGCPLDRGKIRHTSLSRCISRFSHYLKPAMLYQGMFSAHYSSGWDQKCAIYSGSHFGPR
ncbi:Arm DNA-binding domain-containing protein [Methylovulum miyakonense]|uniref:Arm DNA-binding domain-containing protein n=1 Tax=Methylovulum miyakonense TaxID=645578 RepID=UPI00037D2D51